MRRVWLAGIAALAITALFGCSGGGDSNGTTTPATIIDTKNDANAPMGFSFSPSPQTVTSGTPVIWINQSSAAHSIVWDSTTPSTSPGPGANVPQFNANQSSVTWTAPTVTTQTTYAYHCGVHGPAMAGTIVVNP